MRQLKGLAACFAMIMAAALATAQRGHAQGAVNFHGQSPTEEQLIEALSPRVRTRGMSIQSVPAAPPAASLDIKFAFNSAKLTDDARRQLDTLGRAISSERLRDFHFVIEGHTDSVGSDEYNRRLSVQRALSARDYLVQHFRIDVARLEYVGKGEGDLADKANPRSAENRRVVVINKGP